MWPGGAFGQRGRIAPNLMAEQGRTVIFADAPEWREVVRRRLRPRRCRPRRAQGGRRRRARALAWRVGRPARGRGAAARQRLQRPHPRRGRSPGHRRAARRGRPHGRPIAGAARGVARPELRRRGCRVEGRAVGGRHGRAGGVRPPGAARGGRHVAASGRSPWLPRSCAAPAPPRSCLCWSTAAPERASGPCSRCGPSGRPPTDDTRVTAAEVAGRHPSPARLATDHGRRTCSRTGAVILRSGFARRARGTGAPKGGSAPWSGRCGRRRRAPSGRARRARPPRRRRVPART